MRLVFTIITKGDLIIRIIRMNTISTFRFLISSHWLDKLSVPPPFPQVYQKDNGILAESRRETLPKKFFNKKFPKVSFLFVQTNGEPSAIGTPHTNSSASLIRNALKSQHLRVLFLARLNSIKNEILLKNYFQNEKSEK